MATSIIIYQALFAFFPYTPSFAQEDYSPCPILGPRYPQPVQVTASPFVQGALQNLTAALDEIVTSDGNSTYTQTTPETTTFSIALFDANTPINASTPFFYEYHHAAPSFDNKTTIDAESVYSVGGLSQFLTVYTFLVAAGNDLWYNPITMYLPELNDTLERSTSNGVDWNNVLLIDLATHLAGIARDATINTMPDTLPGGLASLLPPLSDEPTNATSKQSFLETLQRRRPIYQPGTTPIYSNAAFQLLALALEKITGKSFADVVQENILLPLNVSGTAVGTPGTEVDAVIPVDAVASGWEISPSDSALLAATGLFSTVADMSVIGQAVLRSDLLSLSTTNRWLKPHSYTSNPRNGVGMPFDIYTPTLTGTSAGPIIEIFTKLGTNGLYSPCFGLVPDYGVGFVVLSADTSEAADLNGYVDLIATYVIAAMEKTAAAEATINYAGNYTSHDGASTMVVDVDGSSGLSVLNWTVNGGELDVKSAYAQLNGIAAETVDMRLYPTNLREQLGNGTNLAFRAVLQDTAAPIDAGTPTCVTWEDGVDQLVYNGIALDEFIFDLDHTSAAVATAVPALAMKMQRVH